MNVKIVSQTTSMLDRSISPFPTNISKRDSQEDTHINLGNVIYIHQHNNRDKQYNPEFNAIKERYSMINESFIESFLESNTYLYALLIKGKDIILEEVKGHIVSSSLELYEFVGDGIKSIFITVYINDIENEDNNNIEDNIINKISSLPSRSLEGKIVVSTIYNES